MRTTVVIPDELFEEVRQHLGGSSLGRFVRESVQQRLELLRRESLVREMEIGYAAEAADPSLEPAWNDIEVEGLG